jgi:hypothetical protein
MSFLKFAEAQFVEKADNIEGVEDFSAPKTASESSKIAVAQFKRTVAQTKKNLALSRDFMYIRTRAIGSLEQWGPNQNGDGFPLKELQASYNTFVGKGNFIDHKSDDIQMIRGLVVDAYMNNEDGCVECLIAVDKVSHPQLVRDIETGTVNSVSMGTRVGYSDCSVCGNVARTEEEYCEHIRNYKGMKVSHYTQDQAHGFGKWAIHEVNHDLEFIELSWVAVPAFKEANVLEKIASLKKAVNEKTAGNDIPQVLQDMHDEAQCKAEECSTDMRANRKEENVKTAAGMLRIKIDISALTFRKTWKDFKATGNVTLDEKEYPWTAYSTDKSAWHLNLDDSASDMISANGIQSIENAVSELLTKNIDTTELIVSKSNGEVKTAYLNNQQADPSRDSYINDRYNSGEKAREKPMYDNDVLEITGTDGKSTRDLEDKAFNESAAQGPSGPLGKRLPKKDLTMNHDEEKYKKELSRAAAKWFMNKQG